MSGTNSFLPEFDQIDAKTKEWIDARSSWLIEQFGRDRIRSCQVALATPEFFPDEFSDAGDARFLLDRLCVLMGIEPHSVLLGLFFEERQADGGRFDLVDDQFLVLVEVTQTPTEMVATIARGLAQIHLIGHGRVSEDADDLEPLIDLLTVYLGLGVITANSSLQEITWQSGEWKGWQLHQRSNSTMPMYGYALALFSRIRDEHNPMWRKSLQPDVRDTFQRSLEYFDQHGSPELRSVKTTNARPTITRPETEADEEDFVPAEMREEDRAIGKGQASPWDPRWMMPVLFFLL